MLQSDMDLDSCVDPMKHFFQELPSDESIKCHKIQTRHETKFNREFEIISEIEENNFGIIRRCRNRLDGLEYAVKIININLNKEYVNLKEILALSAIEVFSDCQYIAKHFYEWIENGKLYIVV